MSYAADTEVSVEKSRAEIERILSKYGATRFAYMTDDMRAIIAFQAHGKFIKFQLPLPDRHAKTITHRERIIRGHSYGFVPRTPEEQNKLWEQACRSRWRALCLCVKAKLEAVACGITSFEQEFLAHFVMPGGQTFGEYAIPQIEEATKTGKMPSLQLMN